MQRISIVVYIKLLPNIALFILCRLAKTCNSGTKYKLLILHKIISKMQLGCNLYHKAQLST